MRRCFSRFSPSRNGRIGPVLGALAMATALLQGSASAQAPKGIDVDGLLACSIVYSRIAELYTELGQPGEAQSFVETSMAFSASALHVAGYNYEVTQATTMVDGRIPVVVQALNSEASRYSKGEQGVIELWLPYCDGIGSAVSQLLRDREVRGW